MTEWIERHEAPTPEYVDALELDDLAPGRYRWALDIADNAAGRSIRLPVLVVRGQQPGPVFGLTAAVHGNELNGIPTIHRLFRRIAPEELSGTVVGVTVVNMPGYIRADRRFPDGADLNRILPGKPDGNESAFYAHRVKTRILDRFDYLVDLHTASFGRVNTLYIRADMNDPTTAAIARAIGAEIIVHNQGSDGTVRACVANRGKPAITVEIGDPQVIDRAKIRASRIGIRDVMEQVGMLPKDDQDALQTAVECSSSRWLYTDAGGILEVTVNLAQRVEEGEVIATIVDPWGEPRRTYRAPFAGIVVGKSTNPVARAGSRIVHLGVVGAP